MLFLHLQNQVSGLVARMTKRTTALCGFFVHAQPVFDGLGRGAARLAGSFVTGLLTLLSPSPLFSSDGGGFQNPT